MPVPPDARPRIGRGFRLQFEKSQDAWVLLYPEGMVRLNGSGGEILRRCDGQATIADIVADLEGAFDTSGLIKDVSAFIGMAEEKNWLELT